MAVSTTLAAQTAMLPISKATTKEDKIKAAHDYEEMFLKFLFKNMIPKESEDGMFGTGHSAEMYQSFWIDAAAKHAANAGDGVGIAKQILKTFERSYPESTSIQQGALHDQHA